MITELTITEGFQDTGKLHLDKPISKRDLKRIGGRQRRVGGAWRVTQDEAEELRSMGYKLNDTAPSPGNWRDDPATHSQKAYLARLGVDVAEDGLTKGRASELIDAAKGDYLGSVGGHYYDGSL